MDSNQILNFAAEGSKAITSPFRQTVLPLFLLNHIPVIFYDILNPHSALNHEKSDETFSDFYELAAEK